MNEELLRRYKKLTGAEDSLMNNNSILLSADSVTGLCLKWEPDKYIEFGSMRIKRRLPANHVLLVTGEMSLSLKYFYRTLRVFRRRTHFILGVYQLNSRWVFALREKDDLILIAPVLSAETSRIHALSDLVVRPRVRPMKDWAKWRKILRAPKY